LDYREFLQDERIQVVLIGADGTAEDDQQLCLIRRIAGYTVNANVEIGDLVSTTLQDRGEGA
jgi:hypothetical protein